MFIYSNLHSVFEILALVCLIVEIFHVVLNSGLVVYLKSLAGTVAQWNTIFNPSDFLEQ